MAVSVRLLTCLVKALHQAWNFCGGTDPSPESSELDPGRLKTSSSLGTELPISLHSDCYSLGTAWRTYNGLLRAIHFRKRTTLFPEENAFILTVTHLIVDTYFGASIRLLFYWAPQRGFQIDRKLNGRPNFFFPKKRKKKKNENPTFTAPPFHLF